MLKRIVICLLATLPAFAQPTCTQVTDTLYQVGLTGPVAMTATIDLTLGYTIAPTGQSVRRVTVTAGAVSVCLVPGNYTATYSVQRPAPLTGSTNYQRTWTVPSGGAVTVGSIEGTTAVTPTTAIAPAQITVGAEGSCMKVIGGVAGWFACFPETWSQINVTWDSLSSSVTWDIL